MEPLEEMHVFASVEDGIIGERVDGVWVPFVCSRPDLAAKMAASAKRFAELTGHTIAHYRFTNRETVEVIEP
jgi:hypothetical protein